MSAQAQTQENLTIFWDWDTTRTSATSTTSIYDVVKNIRAAISPFGAIKAFRAYSDFSVLHGATNFRSELSSSGVTLVDCPGDGRKELSAKIMIVDLLIHAWDHSPPHTIVIITGDRDFGYAISCLRMREYRVVVISPVTVHRDLTAQASAQLDWSRVVLGIGGGVLDEEEFPGYPSAPNQPPSSNSRQVPTEPFSGTHFTSGLRNTRILHDLGHNHNDRKHEPPVELHDLPNRGRKNSVFSTHYDPRKFNIFGDHSHEFTTPKTRTGSFGLGDGPLFPRSGGQSRADSAPPNMHYAANLPMPSLPAYSAPGGNFMGSETVHTSSKGKERDLENFDEFEPAGITLEPEIPMESPTHIPYSGSIFEPFGESQRPFQAMSTSPPSAKRGSTRTSSTSSLSSDSSTFSMINHLEPSTAPTSAEPPSISDKSDITVKPATTKQTTDTELKQANVDVSATPSVQPIATKPVIDLHEIATPVTSHPPVAPSSSKSPGPATTAQPSIIVPQPPSATPLAPGVAQPKPIINATSIPPTSTPLQTRTAAPVPPQFAVLVQVLRREQKGSQSGGVTKTVLGAALVKQNPLVYQQARCTKFGQYIAAAVDAGIVQDIANSRVSLLSQYA